MNEKNQYLKSGQGYSDKDHHFHDMRMWIKKFKNYYGSLKIYSVQFVSTLSGNFN